MALQQQQPTIEKLTSLLQKCRQNRDGLQAKQLHAHLQRLRLDTHPVLGNYLVPLLVDCGSLPEARRLFDRLTHRNIYSWTSLISGYTQCGTPHHAFQLFHKMQEEHTQPNNITFLALLRACARLRDQMQGCTMHTEIVKRGLDTDLFLGSTLVDMYAKCSFLAEARQVFDRLSSHDMVSWIALIAGYDEHGYSEEVLSCAEQMGMEGDSLDDVTSVSSSGVCSHMTGVGGLRNSYIYVASLKACARLKDIEAGLQTHSEIIKNGLESDGNVGNTILDMYCKCGWLSEAHLLFDKLAVQDAVSWTVLVGGYAEHGLAEEALSCFEAMQKAGASLETAEACVDMGDTLVEKENRTNYIYVALLKACAKLTDVEQGRAIHNEIVKKGLEIQPIVGNCLVNMYVKCGSCSEAHLVFDRLSMRGTISWNALTAGYAEHGFGEKALDCYNQMQLEGVSPVAVTLVCSLKACGIVGDLETGQKIHADITMKGLERGLHVGTTTVDMYIKFGLLLEAQKEFDGLPVQDAISWATMISGYSEHGHFEQVLNGFRMMQLQGLTADTVTFIRCLQACGSVGALETGRKVHAAIRKSAVEGELFVGNMLIDMYGKCGSLEEALKVFDKMPCRDVVSWTALIRAYGDNHECIAALQCFEDMQEQGVKPDAITFTCILAACSHANLVLKGKEYFRIMRERYGIEPTLDHCTCMVDLLAKSGHFQEAEKFVEAMQCLSYKEILGAMLNACKLYGKVDLGHTYFQQLAEVQTDGAPFLLMADIYGSAGRWSDVNRMDHMRKNAGAKKKLATAVIEVNEELQEFVVGANYTENISTAIGDVNSQIKTEGYMPNLEIV